MKTYKLVVEIPIDFDYDSRDVELQNQKDIEELYNSHKNILIDLLEDLIINNNQNYKVIIEKIQREES